MGTQYIACRMDRAFVTFFVSPLYADFAVTVILLRCDFGTLALIKPRKKSFYDHACGRSKRLEDAQKAALAPGIKYSVARGAKGTRDCQTQQVLSITTLLQLPPDYLRRYWYELRLFDGKGKGKGAMKGKAEGKGKGKGSRKAKANAQ
jgi:hypothetical protein